MRQIRPHFIFFIVGGILFLAASIRMTATRLEGCLIPDLGQSAYCAGPRLMGEGGAAFIVAGLIARVFSLETSSARRTYAKRVFYFIAAYALFFFALPLLRKNYSTPDSEHSPFPSALERVVDFGVARANEKSPSPLLLKGLNSKQRVELVLYYYRLDSAANDEFAAFVAESCDRLSAAIIEKLRERIYYDEKLSILRLLKAMRSERCDLSPIFQSTDEVETWLRKDEDARFGAALVERYREL